VPGARVRNALGIGRDDLGAEPLELYGDVEGGRVAHVVGLGLERHPEHGDAVVVHAAAERIDGEVDDPLPLAQVDRIDLAQERERLAPAELLGSGGERPDVLRQAPAAEPDAGVQEPSPDAGVVPDRIGERDDVGTRDIGDLGHRMMKLIFVARNALAATFTSSAVA